MGKGLVMAARKRKKGKYGERRERSARGYRTEIDAGNIRVVTVAPKAQYPMMFVRDGWAYAMAYSLDEERFLGKAQFDDETNPKGCVRQHMPGLASSADQGTGIGPGLYMGANAFTFFNSGNECTYSPVRGGGDQYDNRSLDAEAAWDNLIRHGVAHRDYAETFGEVSAEVEFDVDWDQVRDYYQEIFDQGDLDFTPSRDCDEEEERYQEAESGSDEEEEAREAHETCEEERNENGDFSTYYNDYRDSYSLAYAEVYNEQTGDRIHDHENAYPEDFDYELDVEGTVTNGDVEVTNIEPDPWRADLEISGGAELEYDFIFFPDTRDGGIIIWASDPDVETTPPPGPAFKTMDFSDTPKEWLLKIVGYCAEQADAAGDDKTAYLVSVLDGLHANRSVLSKDFESVRKTLIGQVSGLKGRLGGIQMNLLFNSGVTDPAEAARITGKRQNAGRAPTAAQKRKFKKGLAEQKALGKQWESLWGKGW